MTLGAFHVVEIFEILACENIHFSSLFAAARNVPSGEERGETDVFAGYGNFASALNGKRFVGFFPLENSLKKWKIYKGRSVFRLERFERNFLFHFHVSRGFYQFHLLPTRQPSWCPIG